MPPDRIVSLDDVTVRLGRRTVFGGVTCSVGRGEVVAVRGANGSGKTTLLRVLAGVVATKHGVRVGPPTCAYVPAAVAAPPLTGEAWLGQWRRSPRIEVTGALETLGFASTLDTPCRKLSFGNFRKLLLAEAFASQETLLLIDEATAGLDERGVDGLNDLIARNRHRAAFVIADQDGGPLFDANSVWTVGRQSLNQRDALTGQTSIRLRGPISALDQLIIASVELGFAPDAEDAEDAEDDSGTGR